MGMISNGKPDKRATDTTRKRYQRIAPFYDWMEALPEKRYSPWRQRLWSLVKGPKMRNFLPERFTLLILFVFLALFLAACGVISRVPFSSEPAGTQSEDARLANGERIYFTATNTRGERIPYTGGPAFGGMMMGSYLTCAACHGPEARGGVHVMHMQVMDAPDIRYASLSAETGEHGEGEEEGHGEYNLEDFRMAVVEGKHPDGESLSRNMPRWQIGDEDLADLFTFLKSIP